MGAKEQAFELQRQKYQARYNDAVDEVTAATAELTKHTPAIQGVQTNLQLLGKAVETRVSALVAEHTINYGKLIQSVILFKPLRRFLKRAGILVIIAVVVLLYYGWNSLESGLNGNNVTLLVFGILAVMALEFFLERRAQLKGAMDIVHKSADKLKDISLAYIYDDQVAQSQTGTVAYHLIRISGDAKKSAEEFTIAPVSWGVNMRPDSFLLYVSDIAIYRIERDGNLALVFGNSASPLMAYYASYVNQALLEQKSFAGNTLDPLAAYGKAAWRKKKATLAMPQLEKLVRNVDRIENIWRTVAVNDKVIDFLLKRIDSFNVRDRATPPGILLYGSEGNGKTFLAKKIAESIEGRFVAIDAATLTSPDEVRKTWGASRGKDPVLLFVDAAERVFPAAGSQNQGAGTREATLAWVNEWSKFDAYASRVWIVMSSASDSDKEIDRQILSRFGGSKVEIGAPDHLGCELILGQACRDNQILANLPSWVVEEARGMSVRDLVAMVGEAKLQAMPNPPDDATWRKAMRVVRDPNGTWDPDATWDKLILPDAILDKLKTACRILRDAERYKERGAGVPNFLLYGPPGTGKTQAARTIANMAGVPFKEAATADLKGTHIGDSAKMVQDKFREARGVAPSILFIDEMEALAVDRKSSKADVYTKEIVDQMLQEMDGVKNNSGKPIFVLGATNMLEDIDEAIRSRFREPIEIPLPDEKGRRELLKIEIRKVKALDPTLDVDEVAGILAQKTARKGGRDLKQLVLEAVEHAVTRSKSADDFMLTREDLLFKFPPEKTEDLEKLWDRLILPPDIKEQLWTARRIIRDADRYKARGAEIPNILLYGPPGTGKTEIARTLAKLGGVGFIMGTTSEFKGTHIGESAENVRKKFEEARKAAPAVLFIDELESLAATRNSSQGDPYTQEIVTEMLQQMNGVKDFTSPVIVLAATNLPNAIDKAIKDRFSNQVAIPLPDENARRQILKNLIADRPLAPGLNADQLAADMAKATPGRSGRDLLMLVNRAMQRAVNASKSPDDLVLAADNLMDELKPKDVSISEEQLQKIWSEIILPPKVKETILTKIRLFNKGQLRPPIGLLLYGPPGTGKSLIARQIKESCPGTYFLDKKAPDLKGSHIGEGGQLVKELWGDAISRGRTVLFIDECDAVFSQRTSLDTDAGVKEVVNAFIPYWEGMEQGADVWVVGATNHKELIDEAVMSRFGTAVEIVPPDAAGRLEILRLEIKKSLGRDVPVPASMGEATTGLSGRDLKLLAQEVQQLAGENDIAPEMWKSVVDRLKGGRSDAVAEDARWDSLVLPDAMLKKFKTTCRALRQIEAIKKQGIAPPRAILLFGKPGTGKTQIARTMANESGVTFIAAGPSDVKAGYVGQSAPKVHALFERARSQAPCILFIDEMEAAFPQRGGAHADQFAGEIVDQALTELDGVKKNDRFVFLLGATNHPELVDDAILSRFPDKIEVPYPEASERNKILQVLIGKKPVDFDVAQVSAELAAMTGTFSGRDLWSLVENASQAALSRALDNESSSGDELHIVMSREDLISQIAAAADAGHAAGA